MKSFWRDNGLSLVLISVFLVLWVGQALVGRLDYNGDREERGAAPVGFGQYLRSAHFLEATAENWESEFLQMGAYVFLTAFLFQRGSAESKDPDDEKVSQPGEELAPPHKKVVAPWPVRRGGWVLKLYEYSLGIAFLLLFLASITLHALGGSRLYSEEQVAHGKAAVGLWGYLGTAHFWFESLQNWQSEFLAIASMVILSIFLRQRGSSQSKPVAAPHWKTGN